MAQRSHSRARPRVAIHGAMTLPDSPGLRRRVRLRAAVRCIIGVTLPNKVGRSLAGLTVSNTF